MTISAHFKLPPRIRRAMLSAAALLGAAANERPWWSSRMKHNKAAPREVLPVPGGPCVRVM